ncbi:hypothetical protein ADK75_06460 [Streptomyces virginiae]|uniref:Uncharacterized protein n=1 Tax=Streptomyces virginiae TaxID=1961 RepID=A0A0L8N2F0_STRVG|nr:hypothetical protein ADK75_06460 [Streptomyces virginiae]
MEVVLDSAVLGRDVPAFSGQVREVLQGSTATIVRPALSALLVRIVRNTLHPMSWIDLFGPALAAAPLGRKPPALSGSGFGFGARTMLAIDSFSCAARSAAMPEITQKPARLRDHPVRLGSGEVPDRQP